MNVVAFTPEQRAQYADLRCACLFVLVRMEGRGRPSYCNIGDVPGEPGTKESQVRRRRLTRGLERAVCLTAAGRKRRR